MQIFGLDITGEHARLITALAGLVMALGGFVAGRWSKHRARVAFKREDLVASSMIIEMYGIERRADGAGDMLHIVTLGRPVTLDRFFLLPELVQRVSRAARRHPGLIQLADPVAHRMMMDEGKDAVTGLDPRANIDFVQGRPTQDDEILFGFASYSEQAHDGTKLHDEIARMVLMVLSPRLVDQLADPGYIERLDVGHSGYRPRRGRLHDFAVEWQRLQGLPASKRSSAKDKIWRVTVRTSAR